ncbi:MAG: hypothetical protein A3B23_02015 [Candidatus Colwellbacteria bacterium RIFCSPLOWO2_01_FULL_48_10]|nr:MAG: hypothetical protein A3B23_02015 [Candidatus Colwellbacteria bacterium RIFCSPLOWO2_01_FULL_48_10]
MRLDDEELFNQVKNVFRLEPGDKIILANGKGSEGTAEIRSFYKHGIELEILNIDEKSSASKKTVLYLAIIKKDNFELAVQKAVECGIGKIVPMITDRIVKLNLNMDRLKKISIEAAEQSGRADIPEISEPIKFSEALGAARGTNLFFDMGGEPIANIMDKNQTEIGAWIGPEGGWSESELVMAKQKGFKTASLGATTFRAETAAIVGAYLISN